METIKSLDNCNYYLQRVNQQAISVEAEDS